MTFGGFDIQDFFLSLQKYFFVDKKVLVAVSWWVDSMVVSILIYKYFLDKEIPLKQLFFVHLDHWVRGESEQEKVFVQKFFGNKKEKINNKNCDFELIVRERFLDIAALGSQWRRNDEASLRKWRYRQFAEICNEKKIDFLVTGHHLNDRVESTFLHLLRGASLDGFLSMRYCEEHYLLDNTKILRPLLGLTKKKIEQFAKDCEIPFVVDKSNFDTDLSKRNILRNKFFPELFALGNGEDKFLDSFARVYEEIQHAESKIQNDGFLCEEMDLVDAWDAERGYLIIKNKDLRLKNFLWLLKKLWVAQNITEKNLSEIVSFLNTKRSGYKFLNGVNFLVSHWNIYIVKASREFRKVQNAECKMQADENFGDGRWRYPQKWDRFHGKTWKQFCICQKIPLFYRDWVPVCVEDRESDEIDKIVAYFWKGKVRK